LARLRWLTVVIAIVGAALGFIVANVTEAPRGADHSCPAGSAQASCSYPPNQSAWDLEWSLGGFAIGLVLALGLYVLLNRRIDRRRNEPA
jgi:hypothetical protein